MESNIDVILGDRRLPTLSRNGIENHTNPDITIQDLG